MIGLTPATFEEFEREAARGNVVPVVRSVLADLQTPVGAFLRVAEGARHAFLLESVEGGERIARYSFIGADAGADSPRAWRHHARRARRRRDRGAARRARHRLPARLLPRAQARAATGTGADGGRRGRLPRLRRGALVRARARKEFEAGRGARRRGLHVLPHGARLRPRAPADRDHIGRHDGGGGREPRASARTLRRGRRRDRARRGAPGRRSVRARTERRRESRCRRVLEGVSNRTGRARVSRRASLRIKEHIVAGDCYQAVLSQRFSKACGVDPVQIYRALRATQPVAVHVLSAARRRGGRRRLARDAGALSRPASRLPPHRGHAASAARPRPRTGCSARRLRGRREGGGRAHDAR